METGILYAVIAGFFWGTSPILVKRERVDSDVSAATLIQQAAILFTLILFTLLEDSAATGQISIVSMLVFAGALQAIGSVFYLECAALRPCFSGRAHLEYATDHQLFSCAGHPEGIEVVTFRDGIAALVVIGVLVMRWA